MRVNVRIKEIDYCDVILKAMPALKSKAPDDGSAMAKIISVVTQLPDDVIRTMVDAISQEDKNEIVVCLVRENREKLKQVLSQILKQNGIELSLRELSISNKMELGIGIINLNYGALAERYLPMVHRYNVTDVYTTTMLASLAALSGMLLRKAVDKIPQQKKDKIVADLVNKNSKAIMTKIEKIALKQGIRIQLSALNVVV